jgi:3-oxoadipate CoA-transferase alpha subunit
MLNKIVDTLAAAVADVRDGSSILVGGFGGAGVPEGLITALLRQGTRNLTLIHNNAGRDETSIAPLIKHDRVDKLICTFPEAKTAYIFRDKFLAGKIKLELVPQGTLAERIRAGGSGIEGFYTPTGVGTEVAEGKEIKEINGITCILEHALRADFAFVRARLGDRWGNLVYNQASRNFNPMMAMAGKIAIAEVDDIVELGGLNPEHVVTPGSFVQRVVKTENLNG